MTSKKLTRDQILQASDIKEEKVEVPEWGGHVIVRGLTGTQRDAFERTIIGNRPSKKSHMNLENVRARFVAVSVIDGDGKRLFTDDDVMALGGKSASALTKVFDVAQRLSGITDEDMQDLSKNSESPQSDGSTSD